MVEVEISDETIEKEVRIGNAISVVRFEEINVMAGRLIGTYQNIQNTSTNAEVGLVAEKSLIVSNEKEETEIEMVAIENVIVEKIRICSPNGGYYEGLDSFVKSI